MTLSDSSSQHLSLWGGHFVGAPADVLATLSVSTHFDWRLTHVSIVGSHAHADALYAVGLLSDEEITAMHEALNRLDEDVTLGASVPAPQGEDVHTALERGLIGRAGQTLGGKLRARRSRSDQIATLIRMYLREEARHTAKLVLDVVEVIIGQAKNADKAVMPGRTHLQHAQPVLVAHHLFAYAWPLIRDVECFTDWDRGAAVSPYGSGAPTGNTLGMDPGAVTRALGSSNSVENSTDGTASRDAAAEAAFMLAVIGVDISRLCEEIIIWNTKEFDYVTLDDSFSAGLSIMPQKKNPDVAKLGRGEAGRLIGGLMSLLTVLKGIPLACDRGLQENKGPIFDQLDTLDVLLPVVYEMISTMSLHLERMAELAPQGFSLAADIAGWLVRRGIPFRDAHEVSGSCVRVAGGRGVELADLSGEELASASPLLTPEIREVLSVAGFVSARPGRGGTTPIRVTEQLETVEGALAACRTWAAGLTCQVIGASLSRK